MLHLQYNIALELQYPLSEELLIHYNQITLFILLILKCI